MVEITVDEALAKLGGFGYFQWCIFLAIGFGQIAVTFQIYVLSFIAFQPNWQCSNDSLICNITGTVGIHHDSFKARCNMPRSEWTFKDDFTSIVTEFDLVCDRAILATVATTLLFAGWLVGGSISGLISDRYGRKVAFLAAVINITVVSLIGAFVHSLLVFVVVRFFVGVGIGCSICFFIMVTEFCDVKHRGTMCCAYWVSCTIGLCIFPLFAHLLRDWRHLTIFVSCFGLPSFVVWWIIPESIRFCMVKKRHEEVERALKKIATFNRVPMIEEKLQEPDEEQKSSFRDLFATSLMRKITLLSWFIWCSESIVTYGVSYISVSLGGNIYLNFFVINCMDLPATVICAWLINSAGRKRTTLIGLIVSCLASLTGVVFRMHQTGTGLSDGFWVMTIIMSMVSKFFITLSFNAVWVWSNELFPTVVRNTGMGTTDGVARIGAFFSGFGTYLTSIHPLIPYSVFGVFTFLASFACLFLPETAGQPTKELIYIDKPEGDSDRFELMIKQNKHDNIDLTDTKPEVEIKEKNSENENEQLLQKI